MSRDVDLFASSALSATDIADIESDLRQLGLQARSRRMPLRRGVEVSWLLLLVIPAQVVSRTMLEQLGSEAYQALRGFIERVLARSRRGFAHQPSRESVVVESAETGAQFELEADLPLEAYRLLFHEMTSSSAEHGVRTFDRRHVCWRLGTSV